MFKNKYYNISYFFLFIFLIITYFSKIYYKLDDVDEINYLSDSLLLLEGELPSSKHAPGGLKTWFGTAFVFIDFLFNIIIQQKFKSVVDIIQSFDQIIYKHYENLIYIKFSLFLFNTILLIYFYKIDKKKSFFLLFLVCLLSPIFINTILSGKPFFTASLFCAISLILKDKNKKFSLIFFGLAVAEKVEYIILINFICLNKKDKFNINDYFFIILVFFATAPWFTISILQNIKIQLNFTLYNVQQYIALEKKLLIYFFLLTYIFGIFFINFLKNNSSKIILYFLLFFCVFYLVIISGYYIRWFIPLFVISVYEISQLKFIENNKIFLFQLIISIFLIIFNNKNFISDLEILELEKNKMYKSVINESLLVEKLNFKDYVNKRESYLNISNIKNINFFKDKNAPIAFSNSGNIEKVYFRRYEYLAKYADSKAQNQKYIINSNGLATNAQYWCNYLSNNAFMHDNKTKKFVKCK